MLSSCLLDVFHGDWPGDLGSAKAGGILGLFAKATQGSEYADPRFGAWRSAATRANLPFVAYHFLDASPCASQADNFFHAVKLASCGRATRFMVDFEHLNGAGDSPTLQHVDFARTLYDATGVWPIWYCGAYFAELYAEALPDARTEVREILKNCPLMWAQYRPVPQCWPSDIWPTWAIWQYTGDGLGPPPHTLRGFGGPCDLSHFNGDRNALAALFGASPLPQ